MINYVNDSAQRFADSFHPRLYWRFSKREVWCVRMRDETIPDRTVAVLRIGFFCNNLWNIPIRFHDLEALNGLKQKRMQ
jgi:hypothetical protein